MASQVCAIERSCRQPTPRFAVAATHPPPAGDRDPALCAAPRMACTSPVGQLRCRGLTVGRPPSLPFWGNLEQKV